MRRGLHPQRHVSAAFAKTSMWHAMKPAARRSRGIRSKIAAGCDFIRPYHHMCPCLSWIQRRREATGGANFACYPYQLTRLKKETRRILFFPSKSWPRPFLSWHAFGWEKPNLPFHPGHPSLIQWLRIKRYGLRWHLAVRGFGVLNFCVIKGWLKQQIA